MTKRQTCSALLLALLMSLPELLFCAWVMHSRYGKCQHQQQILREQYAIEVSISDLFWKRCPDEYQQAKDKRLPTN